MKSRYAVIGNPVRHSMSPRIHSLFSLAEREELSYEAIFSPIDQFDEHVARFRQSGGLGVNVTVPFKRDAIQLADRFSKSAQESGVANVLSFEKNGIFADNTDGSGLVRDLRSNNQVIIKGRNILIIGAGGATSGVVAPLLDEMPNSLAIVNRTGSKAYALADKYNTLNIAVTGLEFKDLKLQRYDLVINASSASLKGEILPLPEGLFYPGAFAYDMMYGPAAKKFLDFALANGALAASDGLGMLVEQAADSFKIWRGVRPETGKIIKMLRGE